MTPLIPDPQQPTPQLVLAGEIKKLEALLGTMLKQRATAPLTVQVQLRLRLEDAAVQAQILHMTVLLDRPHVAAMEAIGTLTASLNAAVLITSKARVDQVTVAALQLSRAYARSILVSLEKGVQAGGA